MRLRQIALVGQDLDAAKAAIVDVLGLGADYLDPGVAKYGLKNAVWPLGDTFLEVVSPQAEGTTAGRLLEKRGGDGGYMVILQCDDLDAAQARVAQAGVRVVDQFDGDGVHFTHLHPKDVGAAILSIDAIVPRSRWQWGGPDWEKNVRTEVVTGIVGAELQAEDPEALADRWSEVLGVPHGDVSTGFAIPLEGGELRFVQATDGRGDGLRAFDVTAHDPDAVRARARARGALEDSGEITLCGAQIRVKPA